MNRRKTEQQTIFQGVKQTWPPVFKKITSNRSLTEPNSLKRQLPESLIFNDTQFKRPRITAEEQSNIFSCFEQSMRKVLYAKIKLVLKGKNVEKNLSDLEKNLSNSKTLPRGIISDTAKLAGCNPTIINQYLDSNSTKKNNVMWKEFFNKEYQNAVIQLKELTEQGGQNDQSKSVEIMNEEVHRTLSISLNKIYRSDLHDSIKKEVTEKLQESQRKSSDYIIHYSMVINLMISGLCNIILGITFPCFSSKLSQFNTEEFFNCTTSFLNRRVSLGHIGLWPVLEIIIKTFKMLFIVNFCFLIVNDC